MGASQTGQFRFGDFLLDVRERTLLKGGEPGYLPPRTFDTLLALVSRPGQLVSKDDLIRVIWEGGVVSDNALTRCIKEVRQALGDDAKSPSFIETVPRMGYRFIAEVEIIDDSGQAAASPPETEPGGRGSSTIVRRAFSAALVVLAAIVSLWLVTRPPGDGKVEPGVVETKPLENSVAVLPFSDFSGNGDLDYYADGVAEEVTNNLSLSDGLAVMAFNISARYRDPSLDPRAVARELGVRYIVSGSLRQAGDALRLSTTLVDADTGIQLWSMAEDTTVLDAYGIQDSIARGVATALRSELNRDWAQAPGFVQHAPDPEAYDLYLRGRFIWSRRGVENPRAAVDMLSEAVRIDPGFARGWAALASAYLVWPSYSPEGYRTWHLARDAAKQALELDASLAEPRAVLAPFELEERDWAGAARLFEEALEIEPRNATINYWYSENLARTGRYRESMEQLARARALDPTYPPTLVDSVFALALYGRTEEAVRVFDYAWSSGVRSPVAFTAGIISNTLAGNHDRALELVDENPVPSEHKQTMRDFIRVEAGTLDVDTLVSRLEDNPDSWPHYVFFVWMTARLGATDLAIDALEQRLATSGSIETRMLWGPGHRLIEREDFARIASEIGLTDYWESVAWGDFCGIEGSQPVCRAPQPEDAPESLEALLATLDI